MILPQLDAVGDVLLEQAVVQPGVAQAVGPAKVHPAGLLDQLDQQVVPVLGAPGLAQQHHLAVLHRHHRLDGQQAAHHGDGRGDPPAPLQVFQRVQQGHQPDVLLLLIQPGGKLGGVQPLPRQLHRPLHQEPLADGDIFAVHHPDLPRKALGGDARALVGARQLGGQGDAHHRLPGVHGPLERLLKGGGGDLAGGGQLLPLDELLVKAVVVQLHPVQKALLPEGDGQGQDGEIGRIGRQHIAARVGDDPYIHGWFLIS